MASDVPDTERRVPTQDEYEDAVAQDTWVTLPVGGGQFHVQEVQPLKLLRDMDRFGLKALMGQGDADEADIADAIASGDFEAFLEETVLPNILEPDCYWSREDDDDIGDGDFDFAALDPEDMMAVITGMTGQDQDDLQERMDQKFRG